MVRKSPASTADNAPNIILKAILTIGLLAAALLLVRRKNRPPNDRATDDEQAHSHRRDRSVAAAKIAPMSQPHPHNADHHSRRKLPWLEAGSHWAIIGGTIVGAFGLWFLIRSVTAAETATRIATQSMVIENRPWLFVTSTHVIAQAGNRMANTIMISNDGKTVATKIQGYAVLQFLAINESPTFRDMRPNMFIRANLLKPNDGLKDIEVHAYVVGASPVTPIIPTEDMVIGITQRQRYLALHGRITYRDPFGVNHWVQFCDPYLPANAPLNGPLACADYNQVDSNTEPDQQD